MSSTPQASPEAPPSVPPSSPVPTPAQPPQPWQALCLLARLHHPCIARLLDAGVERGRGVPRPDRALVAWLAPAEHAVINLLIEGLSYADKSADTHRSATHTARPIKMPVRR